ncbi:ER membrane protein complex subunit 10 [Modicella reniformis]|uniref:ER membrane protein complex subunit 10 n=1 Tax=Modicella reniformis TaxID=1440133 RepID=A0A9P6MA87_9FUNG|nr:ER membrane protein complex subunit 10 [Modicella reniformis]
MHRAARSLTINTSNACLVNKFNSSSSSSGRPFTPPPPSCRLHKIYEEKLEVLGSLGYENWFDDNANPFYRQSDLELVRRSVPWKNNKQGGQGLQNPFELVDIVIESMPSNNTCMKKPLHPPPQEQRNEQQRLYSNSNSNSNPGLHPNSTTVSRTTFSSDFTGFESLDSDSDQDEMVDFFDDSADEARGLFLPGYRDSSRLDFAAGARLGEDDETAGVRNLRKPKTELEYRRWSNRNRIMDRGQLLPDAAVFLPLPLSREPRFIPGNQKTGGSGPKEVTLGVWHKLCDHESFEKRGEIRFDAEEWANLNQNRDQTTASSTQASSKRYQSQQQKQQQKQQQPTIVYENVQPDLTSATTLARDFVLNIQAPVMSQEAEEPYDRAIDENGEFAETEEEYEQRLAEWKMQQEAEAENPTPKTPGSYAFYQIMLKDEVRGWEAMSSIKSCLLLASDFQELITLHLDNDHQVFSFDYYTTANKCEDDHKKEFALTSLDYFKNVKVDLAVGSVGPKARYAKAQAMRLDQTGNPETEKTFLQKYWMYIVPIVIVMLITGGEPEKTAA